MIFSAGNEGRTATFLCYDGIDVGGHGGRSGYFVILNRTAVVVQRTNVDGQQIGEILFGTGAL